MSGSWLRDGAGLFAANAANHLVAFVIVIAAARALGVEQFGALGVTLAGVVLLASLIDFGSSVALVRLAPRADAAALAFAALAAKGALAAVVLVLAWLADVSLVSACAVGLLGLWTSARAVEQARGAFAEIRRAILLYACLRAIAFAAVWAHGAPTVEAVVACLYGPLVVLLAAAALRAGHWRRHVPDAAALWRAGRALAGYGVWIGVSTACFVALARVPLFTLEVRGVPGDVGLYSAALTFLVAFSLLNDAARAALLPRVARADDAQRIAAMRDLLRRASGLLLALAAAGGVVLTVALPLALGPAYNAALGPWLIVATATVVTIALGIQNLLLHAHGVPQLDAAVNLGRLAALVVLCALVPPTPLALAWAYALVLVAGELALHASVARHAPPAHVAEAAPG